LCDYMAAVHNELNVYARVMPEVCYSVCVNLHFLFFVLQ
jgi:hypothetical protein